MQTSGITKEIRSFLFYYRVQPHKLIIKTYCKKIKSLGVGLNYNT